MPRDLTGLDDQQTTTPICFSSAINFLRFCPLAFGRFPNRTASPTCRSPFAGRVSPSARDQPGVLCISVRSRHVHVEHGCVVGAGAEPQAQQRILGVLGHVGDDVPGRSWLARTRRLVRLSSTTSTRRPARKPLERRSPRSLPSGTAAAPRSRGPGPAGRPGRSRRPSPRPGAGRWPGPVPPTESPGRRGIALGERVEQAGCGSRDYADPGVGHIEADHHLLRRGLLHQRRPLGEIEDVVDDSEERLTGAPHPFGTSAHAGSPASSERLVEVGDHQVGGLLMLAEALRSSAATTRSPPCR